MVQYTQRHCEFQLVRSGKIKAKPAQNLLQCEVQSHICRKKRRKNQEIHRRANR
jgi:hypothetical protein